MCPGDAIQCEVLVIPALGWQPGQKAKVQALAMHAHCLAYSPARRCTAARAVQLFNAVDLSKTGEDLRKLLEGEDLD